MPEEDQGSSKQEINNNEKKDASTGNLNKYIPLIRIVISIGSLPVEALIDTGASVSLINLSVFESINITILKV